MAAIGNDGKKVKMTNHHLPTSGSTYQQGSLNSTLQITIHKENGQNFLPSSQSVHMIITSRGKIGCINGDIQQPEKSGNKWKTWQIENSMVVAWIMPNLFVVQNS